MESKYRKYKKKYVELATQNFKRVDLTGETLEKMLHYSLDKDLTEMITNHYSICQLLPADGRIEYTSPDGVYKITCPSQNLLIYFVHGLAPFREWHRNVGFISVPRSGIFANVLTYSMYERTGVANGQFDEFRKVANSFNLLFESFKDFRDYLRGLLA